MFPVFQSTISSFVINIFWQRVMVSQRLGLVVVSFSPLLREETCLIQDCAGGKHQPRGQNSQQNFQMLDLYFTLQELGQNAYFESSEYSHTHVTYFSMNNKIQGNLGFFLFPLHIMGCSGEIYLVTLCHFVGSWPLCFYTESTLYQGECLCLFSLSQAGMKQDSLISQRSIDGCHFSHSTEAVEVL